MELALDAVTSGYGGIPIVREVSLEVGTGEIVAIVGRNGVGKTTLIETIAGLLPVMEGGIAFRGRDVTRADARDRARLGMGYVPQGRGIFSRLSVEENLRMGELVGGGRAAAAFGRVYEWFPRLAERRRQRAGTLSGGEQQMLAIGRILVGQPSILLLDEPSEGIQPTIVEQIADVIAEPQPRRTRSRCCWSSRTSTWSAPPPIAASWWTRVPRRRHSRPTSSPTRRSRGSTSRSSAEFSPLSRPRAAAQGGRT